MRVGAMVAGILLAIWTFFEAFLANFAGNVSEDEGLQTAASLGLLASILIGIGAVIILAAPQVSMVLFGLAAIFGYSAAANGWGNQWVYATIMVGLAIMAFFGWRGKKRDQREKMEERARQQARDDRMEELVRQSQVRPVANQLVPCPTCGYENPAGTKFCADCGSQLPTPAGGSLGAAASRAASTAPSMASASMPNLGFGQEEPQKKKRFGRS